MARMKFMNTEIDNLTMQETLWAIDQLIQEKKSAYVVTPNVDHIVQLETNKELQAVYKNASLILTDGKPLLWIANWYGTPIKEKISGSDLFPLLCEMAAEKGYKMFFLGAAEGVAAKAAENLMNRFKGLQVVGTYSPPFGFEKDPVEMDKIKSMIKEATPHILIVGLGCPKQEKFMYHHCAELGVPISFGLGASFDFEAGNIKRAPRWMANHGLEWLFRITQDPKRMAKRYLVDDRKILGLVCYLTVLILMLVLPIRKILEKPLSIAIATVLSGALPLSMTAILSIPRVNALLISINETATMNARVRIYEILMNIITQNYWIGYGYNTLIVKERLYSNAQNGMLHIIVQFGMLGAATLVLLCYIATRNRYKRNKDVVEWCEFWLFALIVAGIIEITFGVFFYVFLALINCATNAKEERRDEDAIY